MPRCCSPRCPPSACPWALAFEVIGWRGLGWSCSEGITSRRLLFDAVSHCSGRACGPRAYVYSTLLPHTSNNAYRR